MDQPKGKTVHMADDRVTVMRVLHQSMDVEQHF